MDLHRLNSITATAVFAAGILLAGCKTDASLLARQDPAYAPTKADPVFVTVGAHSTIQDRQMLPLIKQEFQAEGFNLTDFENSKWVVVIGRDDRTIVTGTTSTSVGVAVILALIDQYGKNCENDIRLEKHKADTC
jgi:hypothetical protein